MFVSLVIVQDYYHWRDQQDSTIRQQNDKYGLIVNRVNAKPLQEKLRQVQQKDVYEMEAILGVAAVIGDANEACRHVLGGAFNLSEGVAEAIAGRGLRYNHTYRTNRIAYCIALFLSDP